MVICALATHSQILTLSTTLELIDIIIVGMVDKVKRGKDKHTKKGIFVTEQDFEKSASAFRVYSLIYPFLRIFSMLDVLLFFRSGYMLIASAQVNKYPNPNN